MDYFLGQRLIEEENMLAPSLKQFSLRVEILPSYIPVRVAEKILFVGESVQMFENQNVNLTRKGRDLLAPWTPFLRGPSYLKSWAPESAWAEWPLYSEISSQPWVAGPPEQPHLRDGITTPAHVPLPLTCLLFCRIHFERPGGHLCCRAAPSQAAASLQPGGLWAGGGSHTQHRGGGLSFSVCSLGNEIDEFPRNWVLDFCFFLMWLELSLEGMVWKSCK